MSDENYKPGDRVEAVLATGRVEARGVFHHYEPGYTFVLVDGETEPRCYVNDCFGATRVRPEGSTAASVKRCM